MFLGYQYISSVSSPVLENHSFPVFYINSILIDNLVRSSKNYKVELKIKNAFIIQKQRDNNSFIMDKILTFNSSRKIIKTIHICRFYLQMTFLSEITNIKGNTLRPEILTRTKPKYSMSNINWTIQSKSNVSSWNL